jgi:hypothetical protein
MKKENITAFTSPFLVFILTHLALRDFFHPTSITQIGLIGGFSGLISICWYNVIKGKSFSIQLILTSFYVTMVLLIGFFYIREDRLDIGKRDSKTTGELIELKNRIEGTWISRPLSSTDAFLKFSFFSNDSLIASVNQQSFRLTYDIIENDHILIYDLNDILKFDLIIHRLDSDSLIFTDRERFLKFSKD